MTFRVGYTTHFCFIQKYACDEHSVYYAKFQVRDYFLNFIHSGASSIFLAST